MSSCIYIREALLDFGWDLAARKRAEEVLRHLETCPECAAAAADYDRLRAALTEQIPTVAEQARQASNLKLPALRRPVARYSVALRAIAAGVVVAFLGYTVGRLAVPAARPMAQMQSQTAPSMDDTALAFSQGDIARQVAAFDQVSTVFDDRATWLLDSDHKSDMGLSQQAIEPQRHLLLIRLAIQKSGQTVSSADLAIVPGQTAKLDVPMNHGNSVSYEISTSAGEPTRLGIWAELNSPTGGEAMAALATTLRVEPGQKLSAGSMLTSAGDYELKIAFWRTDFSGDVKNPVR